MFGGGVSLSYQFTETKLLIMTTFFSLENSITAAYNTADQLHNQLQEAASYAADAAGLKFFDKIPEDIACMQKKADAMYELRNQLWDMAKNQVAKIEKIGEGYVSE